MPVFSYWLYSGKQDDYVDHWDEFESEDALLKKYPLARHIKREH